MTLGEIELGGEEALRVADALTFTSMRILQLVSVEPLDISTIAQRLGLSEPYISEQMRKLEGLKIVRVRYERGKRGIRKLCELAVSRIIIVVKEVNANGEC